MRQWRKDNRKKYAVYNHRAKVRKVEWHKRKRNSDPSFRNRIYSHTVVQRAVASGKIVKSPFCQLCWDTVPVDAHHYSGYEKEHRLTVAWLCEPCHYFCHRCKSH
jgi:hypothetical protein